MEAIAPIVHPAIPATWLKHTAIRKDPGYRARCTACLRHLPDNAHTPFVVHIAFVDDKSEWAYERGDYYRTLETALKGYDERAE